MEVDVGVMCVAQGRLDRSGVRNTKKQSCCHWVGKDAIKDV